MVGPPLLTAPGQAGQPYRIEAAIANRTAGQGQVEVIFRLRNLATGQVYQRVERTDLKPGEQIQVDTEIPAPQADYQPEVEVRYPPG